MYSLLLRCLLWRNTIASISQTPDLQVVTSSGIINGIYNNTAKTVRGFIGIPYAEPPVGSLRWAPPIPKISRKHVDASSFSNPCAQVYTYSNESIWSVLPYKIWNSASMSEDCLYMNIWAPSSNTQSGKKRDKAAVMMFIHGGSYFSGAGSVAYYDGTYLAQDHNVVVVTFNYRLTVFGFPNSPDIDSTKQNLGLLDQRMAIEWVHRNIARFGGDPDRILLFGQSAGASSADLYSYAYADEPLVNAIALHSGTAPLLVTPPGHDNWNNLSQDLGCGIGERSLSCMNEVPAMKIIETRLKGNYNFYPVVDDVLVFSDYADRARKGQLAHLPTLAGMTEREYSALIPLSQVSVNMTPIYQGGQMRYNCPLRESVRIRVKNHIPTWRYLYHGNFSSLSPTTWLGAYHGSEIPMIFGTYNLSQRYTPSAAEAQASQYIQAAWVAFANDPYTGLTEYGWPQFRFQEPTLINIALNNTIPAVFTSARWDRYCQETEESGRNEL